MSSLPPCTHDACPDETTPEEPRTDGSRLNETAHFHIPSSERHPYNSSCHAASRLTPHQIALAGHRRRGTIDNFWIHLGVPPRVFFDEERMKDIWSRAEDIYATSIKGFNITDSDTQSYRDTIEQFRRSTKLCRVDQSRRHQLALAHLTPTERSNFGFELLSPADSESAELLDPSGSRNRAPWNTRTDTSPMLQRLYTVPNLYLHGPDPADNDAGDAREAENQDRLWDEAASLPDNLTREQRIASPCNFARGCHNVERLFPFLEDETFWEVESRTSTRVSSQTQPSGSSRAMIQVLPALPTIEPPGRRSSTGVNSQTQLNGSSRVGVRAMPATPTVGNPGRRQPHLYQRVSPASTNGIGHSLTAPGPSTSRAASSANRIGHNLTAPGPSTSRATATECPAARVLPTLPFRAIGSAWRTEVQEPGLPPRALFDRPYEPCEKVMTGSPSSIEDMPGYELLTKGEGDFCCWNKCRPDTYLDCRRRLFKYFHEYCRFDESGATTEASYNKWSRSRAQEVKGMDANKLSRLYQFYKDIGLFKQSWLH